MPRVPDLPRPTGPRTARAHLRLVGPSDGASPVLYTPFVENDLVMPTVNLSTDTPLTFTFRGLTVPTVEALCAELATRRAAGEHTNPKIFDFDPTEFHYGAPKIVVTGIVPVFNKDKVVNADESVMLTRPWDHTVWSLLEAAEIARHYEGAVYVSQDVHAPALGGEDADEVEEDGSLWVDEGFEVLAADYRPAYAQSTSTTPSQRAAAYLAAHPDALSGADDDDDDDDGEE